ncbi:MAG TPA: twin-arginine translocation signal domain-containing protein [Blastocatellia bacterium]
MKSTKTTPPSTDQSRRRFLKTGSMVGAATMLSATTLGKIALAQQSSTPELGSGIGFRIPKQALRDPLYQIDRDMFQETVGSAYGFWQDEGKVSDATLVTVRDMTPVEVNGGVAGPKQCFALIFAGSPVTPMHQGTYQVLGGNFPVFRLFIGPGKETDEGIKYVAIINRLF